MRDVTLLMIWLVALFGFIGCVMAAVAQFVRKDSMAYDKRYTWSTYIGWGNPKDQGKKEE